MSLEFYSPTFSPAARWASPHVQTIVASVLRPPGRLLLERERWDTADGDFLDVDVLKAAEASAPHVVILHGLEGSSQSGYVRATLWEAQLRGYGAFALNFRSCSGEPNRLARSYHSGEIEDARFTLQRIRQRTTGPLFAVGFSLGANILLRLLQQTAAEAPVKAAVAISAPFFLSGCADALDASNVWAYVYRTVFLRSLRQKAFEKARRFPHAFDVEALRRAKTIRAFDAAVTAPLHGFRDEADYYEKSSSGPRMSLIRRPTLLIQAKDDPFIPYSDFPTEAVRANPNLTVLSTDWGGHVGFMEGTASARRYWAERAALSFIAHHTR